MSAWQSVHLPNSGLTLLSPCVALVRQISRWPCTERPWFDAVTFHRHSVDTLFGYFGSAVDEISVLDPPNMQKYGRQYT